MHDTVLADMQTTAAMKEWMLDGARSESDLTHKVIERMRLLDEDSMPFPADLTSMPGVILTGDDAVPRFHSLVEQFPYDNGLSKWFPHPWYFP